jgi:predicted membrane protein
MDFLTFFIFWAFIFHIFWAYLAIFFGLISHYKPLTESLKPKSKHTTTKTKTKTYYTESLKPKPKGPKHTIKLQTTESLKLANTNKIDITSLQHMAQNP